MWQFIKQAWALSIERSNTRKALRTLNKQQWSVEFLTAMLVRASNVVKQPLEMTIIGPGGVAIRINTIDNIETPYRDDNIFNHLDDEVRMRQFMESIK